MEDCIKIEELKMFLGTDLSCQFENPKWEEDYQPTIISDKLKGIIGNDIYIGDEVLTLEDFMPIVKPLTELSEEHAIELCKMLTSDLEDIKFREVRPVNFSERVVVGDDGCGTVFFYYESVRNISCTMDIITQQGMFFNMYVYCGSVRPTENNISHLCAINYLASKHYDIFNWIGRGLANEMK